MSANSQATGNNRLSITVAPTASLSIGGWVKPTFDKTAFGSILAVERGQTTPNYRSFGIQQDPTVDGTNDNFKGFYYNEAGGFVATANIIASSVWTFTGLTIAGTTNATGDFYWGTETGALNHEQVTSNFSVALLTAVILGSDFYDEHSNCLFRGWGLWVDTALTSGEWTTERDRTDYVRQKSGVTSDIRIVNGTNPHIAAVGSDWTLTGTFTDGATDPAFPASGVPFEHFASQRVNRNTLLRM